jgi:hypothetical protein
MKIAPTSQIRRSRQSHGHACRQVGYGNLNDSTPGCQHGEDSHKPQHVLPDFEQASACEVLKPLGHSEQKHRKEVERHHRDAETDNLVRQGLEAPRDGENYAQPEPLDRKKGEAEERDLAEGQEEVESHNLRHCPPIHSGVVVGNVSRNCLAERAFEKIAAPDQPEA